MVYIIIGLVVLFLLLGNLYIRVVFMDERVCKNSESRSRFNKDLLEYMGLDYDVKFIPKYMGLDYDVPSSEKYVFKKKKK
jgi:hypothetical protein